MILLYCDVLIGPKHCTTRWVKTHVLSVRRVYCSLLFFHPSFYRHEPTSVIPQCLSSCKTRHNIIWFYSESHACFDVVSIVYLHDWRMIDFHTHRWRMTLRRIRTNTLPSISVCCCRRCCFRSLNDENNAVWTCISWVVFIDSLFPFLFFFDIRNKTQQ